MQQQESLTCPLCGTVVQGTRESARAALDAHRKQNHPVVLSVQEEQALRDRIAILEAELAEHPLVRAVRDQFGNTVKIPHRR